MSKVFFREKAIGPALYKSGKHPLGVQDRSRLQLGEIEIPRTTQGKKKLERTCAEAPGKPTTPS